MTILLFIIVLVVLIVGHEAGHFIVAKRSGMRVDEFGIGFPPKIWGVRFGGGETEYTINWLPLGGFVKIFGEDKEDGTVNPRAFSNRPPLSQAAVLFAGPFANVVLAFLLSSAAFMVGTPTVIAEGAQSRVVGEPKVLIGEVLPDSPAAQAGIRVGDEVRALTIGFDAHLIASPGEVSERIANAEGPITLTLAQGGAVRQVTIEAIPGLVDDDPERRVIGIATALVGTVVYPPHRALWKGLTDTINDFFFILVSLAALIGQAFTLSADVSNLAGPVGIASLTGEAAAFGMGSLLSFAALLSVNLAIINLLPFPALDGGRLLFLGLETLFRRRIPARITQAVNAGGFFVLILLMLAVTVGDITRLLG